MPELTEKTKYPGIYRRHGRTCKGSSRANCGCPYQATVWSSKDNKLLKRQALTLSEARQWREDAASAIRAGRLQAPSDATFQEKADELIQGRLDGSIYDRSGKPYLALVVAPCSLNAEQLPAEIQRGAAQRAQLTTAQTRV